MALILEEFPKEIQELCKKADKLGFGDYWYSPEYGLYATYPGSTIDDERMSLTEEDLINYENN